MMSRQISGNLQDLAMTKQAVKFQLLPQNELVSIPDELFIYSTFLREYKKGMMKDKLMNNLEGETIIPLCQISNKPVLKQHIDKLCEFFTLYTRHNYGPGSSAKKVPSSLDVRTHQNAVASKAAGASYSNKIPKEDNGPAVSEMEIKADAKWSKLPDWAHGWFSALDKNILIGTANVANFLTATPFIEHYSNFLAVMAREMDNSNQIMEYLNFSTYDPEGEALRKLLYGSD